MIGGAKREIRASGWRFAARWKEDEGEQEGRMRKMMKRKKEEKDEEEVSFIKCFQKPRNRGSTSDESQIFPSLSHFL